MKAVRQKACRRNCELLLSLYMIIFFVEFVSLQGDFSNFDILLFNFLCKPIG